MHVPDPKGIARAYRTAKHLHCSPNRGWMSALAALSGRSMTGLPVENKCSRRKAAVEEVTELWQIVTRQFPLGGIRAWKLLPNYSSHHPSCRNAHH